MSRVAGALRSLAKRVGFVVGMTETCPTCGGTAPAGTATALEDGPREDAHGVPLCTRCRLPLEAPGLLVKRVARGYLVHAKVVDLR